MSSLVYWGFVLAGAITLLIEANRNFSSSLKSTPFSEHPILQNVEVARLCTTREKNIGLVFYSSLYLVTYIIVLSSAEVYELLSQAARSTVEIGPADEFVGPEGDPTYIPDAGYGKPIFISAAIIAVFSLGALRPIETTMRALSYRLAGIPRGIFTVIEDLHSFKFRDLKGSPTPLNSTFVENAKSNFEDPFDQGQTDVIQEALLTIDHLAPALTGKLREYYFPPIQLAAMGDLSVKLEKDIEGLKGLISALSKKADEEKKAIFFRSAMSTANDTIALFAVHYLRNNRAIKTPELQANDTHDRAQTQATPAEGDRSSLRSIGKKIQPDYQVELNAFGLSLVISLIFSITFGYSVYRYWDIREAPISADGSEPKVRELLTSDAEKAKWDKPMEGLPSEHESDRSLIDACAASPGGSSHLLDPTGEQPVTATQEANVLDVAQLKQDCEDVWRRVIQTARIERLQGNLRDAFREIVPVALGVVLAALTAILGRDVRFVDNSWPSWKLHRPPFLQLLSMSLVPAALAVVGVALGAFIGLWIRGGFYLTQTQITFFFESNAVYFLMHAPLGLIVSFGVLTLIDQHDHLYAPLTVIMGLLWGILALLCYYVVVIIGYAPGFIRQPRSAEIPFEVREMLVYGSFGLFFMLFFGFFLEITEKPRRRRVN